MALGGFGSPLPSLLGLCRNALPPHTPDRFGWRFQRNLHQLLEALLRFLLAVLFTRLLIIHGARCLAFRQPGNASTAGRRGTAQIMTARLPKSISYLLH